MTLQINRALAMLAGMMPVRHYIPKSIDATLAQPSGGKGQLRAVKPKPSGAASFKRAARKRANIRKHGKRSK